MSLPKYTPNQTAEIMINLYGTFHVHVVEDEAINRQILQEILKDERYRLSESPDGHHCLEYLKHTTPDVILLDIKMPGIDGFETCRRLKQMPTMKGVPIIFLTSVEDPAEIQKGMDLGAADYILKPYKPSVVKGRIFNVLDGFKADKTDIESPPEKMPI